MKGIKKMKTLYANLMLIVCCTVLSAEGIDVVSLRQKAEKGDADAQHQLATCLMNGEGLPTNQTEAVKWLQKAVEQGHGKACQNLGWCYENGNGVEKDAVEAVKWYLRAAETGNVDAMKNLSICYSKGLGVEKNGCKEYEWLARAADAGDADAMLVAGMFRNVLGRDSSDLVGSVRWICRSADKGNVEAERWVVSFCEEKRSKEKWLGICKIVIGCETILLFVVGIFLAQSIRKISEKQSE